MIGVPAPSQELGYVVLARSSPLGTQDALLTLRCARASSGHGPWRTSAFLGELGLGGLTWPGGHGKVTCYLHLRVTEDIFGGQSF